MQQQMTEFQKEMAKKDSEEIVVDSPKSNKNKELKDKLPLQQRINSAVKQTMNFIGFLLSGLGGVGYLITIAMIVFGASGVEFELIGKDGVFFGIGFSFGLLIRTGFYMQGSKYARLDFISVIDEYNSLKQVKQKEKKTQSYEFKMFMSYTFSTLFSLIWFFVFSVGVVYLAGFEGMQNMVYLWNAISNMLVFTGFGFLALNSSYEKYIVYKVPVIKERIRLIREQELKDKTKEAEL